MKVNLIVNSFPTPSETFLFNLIVGLESKGVDVTVIASEPAKHMHLYAHRLHEWSGKIKYIPGKSIKGLIKCTFIFLKHVKLIYTLKKTVGLKKAIGLSAVFDTIIYNHPEIVHFSFSGIAIQYQNIIPELNKYSKTVVSCRGTGEKFRPIIEPNRKQKLINTLNLASSIHCVSDDIKNTIEQLNIDNKSIFINPPAVIESNFIFNKKTNKQTTDVFNIVTTGRLSFEKGYIYALKACFDLKKSGYKFVYNILGDGPDWPMLAFMIHEMQLTDYIKLHGKVNSETVKQFLHKADIFLLPSIYEGISNAALEAMCVGLPIVTTTAGGMPEVVKDGINGRIVPTYDSDAIYEAIRWTIDNYGKSIQMALKAKETITRRHTHEHQINLFLNHYSYILS